MACNSYETYPSCRCGGHGCGSCAEPDWRPWNADGMYFPDFVANSCCNPCCSGEVAGISDGCHVCNAGGTCGSSCWGDSCRCGHRPHSGCGNWNCHCCRCNSCGWGDDWFGCPTPIQPR